MHVTLTTPSMSSIQKGYIDCDRTGQISDVDGNPLVAEPTTNRSRSRSFNSLTVTNSQWKIIFYIPNLMGYLRIFLAFHGYRRAIRNQQHNIALNMWIAASILDLFDGIAARKLNQCSQFGMLLDIIADNILRSIMWISCIRIEGKYQRNDDIHSDVMSCIWTATVFLEWITMFCSQMNAARSENGHWKDMTQNSEPPFWVQAVFRNNFRTFLGVLTIYGLFVAPMGTYVMYADESIWPRQLLSERGVHILVAISYIGRILSGSVELWICFDYARYVINHDASHCNKEKAA